MIIDTIKLIASDLADMSPKTQLEIVKLCKNLCLAVKDYLVENDENIETINEYIENLQTAVSNLNVAITDLNGELTTAEGNIQANANAILVLQNAVATIQSALNNVYSKTEINDLLTSYYTKSQVNNLLLDYYTKSETYNKTEIVTLLLDYYTKSETYSKTEIDTKLLDYYTMVQINNLLSGKLNASDVCFLTIENRYTPVSVDDFNKMYASKLGVIFYNGYKYYYTGATTLNDVITLNFNSYVVENGVTKVMALSSDTRLISPIDADVAQPILVSGTNIKTINGQSLLGSGDLVLITDLSNYESTTDINIKAKTNKKITIGRLNPNVYLVFENSDIKFVALQFVLVEPNATFNSNTKYYLLVGGNYQYYPNVTADNFETLKSRLYVETTPIEVLVPLTTSGTLALSS